ncbi:similar to Saccharomyces cerevisiae YBR086C IST2 Plasma membrane protein that may be involved in osmotolerance [Maudiozyma saulgeensis]|uniref:Similar to Saccharomyces cerevisiae YBR086C IST2 Plasma membrane protein that may be involved in osmotolerance n=1 Tax=Maudiozyma saulgeensis TaxID=1789683 RepID=A0A1X7R8R5_9SACH|nr:similar to Saccharomyces cerevisiae YBR086C IST2 Plasma membrane protein that may be involved in osmotolerance [Kazachstania saulgeensis]
MKKYNTLEELDPNCVVVFSNEHQNKNNLLALLEAFTIENTIPINLRFEHGYQPTTDYLFLRVDSPDIDVFLTTSIKELTFVKDIIPLYDTERSKKLNWLFDKTFKKNIKALPSDDDLKLLTNLTNDPKLSLYFAFFKYYNKWLGYLAIPGIFVYYYSNDNSWEFNTGYTILNVVWSIAFITSWIYNKQLSYGNLFGSFKSVYSIIGLPDGSTAANSVTSRTFMNLLFVPILILFGVLLMMFQFACFLLEIYLTQIYDGPMVAILSLLPTVLISVFVPILSLIYNKIFIEPFINIEKPINKEKSRIEKNFIIKFCSSYMPLLITLFVYLPLSYLFNSEKKLELSLRGFPVKTTDYIVNTSRHQSQFFYFIVTNSLILFVTDNVVPIVLTRLTMKATAKKDGMKQHQATVEAKLNRHGSKDLEIWSIVRGYETSAWGQFDTDINFQKLVLQFGYIAMFGTIWPIAPAILFLFNIIILKVDYWKVTNVTKPKLIPGVLDMITTTTMTNGEDITKTNAEMTPWNGVLRIIVWISTLVTPTLTIMYRSCYLPGIGNTPILNINMDIQDKWYIQNPIVYNWSTILITAVITEHIGIAIFFILRNRYLSIQKPVIMGGFVPTMKGEINYNDTKESNKIESIDGNLAPRSQINEYTNETNELIHRENKRTEREKHSSSSSNLKDKSPSVGIIASSDSSSDTTLPPNSTTPELLKDTSNLDLHKVSSVDLRAPIKDISKLGSSDSEIAGATVPKMIPTSKNFDSRNNSEQVIVTPTTSSSMPQQPRTSTPLKNVVATAQNSKPIEDTNTDKITAVPQRSNTKKSVKIQPSVSSNRSVTIKVTEDKTDKDSLTQPPSIHKTAQQIISPSNQSSIKDTQSNNSGARRKQDVSVSRQTSKQIRPKSMVISDPQQQTTTKKKKRGILGKLKNVL